MKRKLLVLLALLACNPAYGQLQRVIQSKATTLRVFMRDSTTGLGKTGIAVGGITVRLTKETDTLAAASTTWTCTTAGTGSHDCSEEGDGWYNFEVTTSDTGTRGRLELLAKASGAWDGFSKYAVVSVASDQVNTEGNITDVPTIGAGVWANATGAAVAANVDTTISSRLAPTDGTSTLDISSGGAGINWGNIKNPTTSVALSGTSISSAGSVTGAVGSVTGNVGGNVTGTVGSVIGNVGGSIGSVASGGITAASIATDAFTAAKFAADTAIEFAATHGVIPGTAQAGGNNTITLAASLSIPNSSKYSHIISLTGGTGFGQTGLLIGWDNTTKIATILCQESTTGNWLVNPDNTTTYSLIPFKR